MLLISLSLYVQIDALSGKVRVLLLQSCDKITRMRQFSFELYYLLSTFLQLLSNFLLNFLFGDLLLQYLHLLLVVVELLNQSFILLLHFVQFLFGFVELYAV
jgi:hypothetical protein